MRQVNLALLAAGGMVLAASSAFAGPAPIVASEGAVLVQKTGGVYVELGGPRYNGSDFYYDRYPAYRYAGPRRYYGYGDGYYADGYYDRPNYSRRWTRERFEHPLGRR